MNRHPRTPHRSPVTGTATRAAAWDASPADLESLVAHVEPDAPGGAGAGSAMACASLPATTSAWLDGLLGLHRPAHC